MYFISPYSECIPLTVTINGYIEYKKQKYGWLAYSLLYILFDIKEYWKIVKSMGQGWRCAWWLPKNYLNNMVHLIRKKHRAIPVTSAQRKFKQLFKRPQPLCPVNKDDLPF